MPILAITMMTPDTSIINDGALPIHMGEATDFERMFLLYHAPLRYFCEKLTGANEESEDIVSRLFLTLWQKQVSFQNTEHAQAYLYRSVKNACLNFIRNEKRADEKKELLGAEINELTASHLDTFIRAEVWAELYRAIQKLPLQNRKVISMSYLDGMSNQEIADEMGLPMETIKTYKKRGLGMLRNNIPENLFAVLIALSLLK